MKQLRSIQYLRGAAAFMVIVAHSFEYPALKPSIDSMITGRLGVVLFFVISGFIMVLTTGVDSFDPLNFLKKRIERIVPIYWLFTIITFSLAVFAGGIFKTTRVSMATLIQSLLFIPHMNTDGQTIGPIMKLGWTLNYEAFFYAVFAALFFLRVKGRVAIITILFSAMVIFGNILHSESLFARFYLSSILLSFCVGAWIGLIWLNATFERRSAGLWWIFCIMIIASGIAMFTLERSEHPLNNTRLGEMILFSASAIGLGLWAEQRGVLRMSKTLMKLGDASYSLYLVHMFGLGAAFMLARKIGMPYPVIVPVEIFAGTIAGLVAYTLVEQPIIGFFRRGAGGKSTLLAKQPA